MTEKERTMKSIQNGLKMLGEIDNTLAWVVLERLQRGRCPICADTALQSLNDDRPVMRVDCSRCGVRHFHMGTYKEVMIENPFKEEIEI